MNNYRLRSPFFWKNAILQWCSAQDSSEENQSKWFFPQSYWIRSWACLCSRGCFEGKCCSRWYNISMGCTCHLIRGPQGKTRLEIEIKYLLWNSIYWAMTLIWLDRSTATALSELIGSRFENSRSTISTPGIQFLVLPCKGVSCIHQLNNFQYKIILCSAFRLISPR